MAPAVVSKDCAIAAEDSPAKSADILGIYATPDKVWDAVEDCEPETDEALPVLVPLLVDCEAGVELVVVVPSAARLLLLEVVA